MCRRVDIPVVASFKLRSVDVRLGANEATADPVRVRLSYSSNKVKDPYDKPTDEHSRANVLCVTSDCLLWTHRILVLNRSLFVLRIDCVIHPSPMP